MKNRFYPGGTVQEIGHYLPLQYEEVDFDISKVRPPANGSGDADKNKTAYLKVMSLAQQMLEEWENGDGPLVKRNQEIMASLAIPVRQNPSPLELLRTLELHGNGLQLYTGKEQTVEKGDLIADARQQTWMISSTDEQHRLKKVSGGFSYQKGMKPEDLVKEHTYFKLIWSPCAGKRHWLPGGQQASVHYKDPDAVFTHMIRLWGENKAPVSGRRMSSAKEFLQEWLETAGIWDTTFPFSANPGLRETLNYLESHGNGLQVFDPSRILLAPGDLLIPYHRSSLALVTRANQEKQLADVLESGTYNKGPLGEPADTARMRYQVPFAEFQYYWSPDPEYIR